MAVSIDSLRTEADAQAFARLNVIWISELFTLEPADQAALGDPRGAIIEPGGEVLMARDGARVVGCAALIAAGDGSFELSKMAVDPAERGRGVGRLLATAAVQRARELGAPSIFLVSNSRLAPAVALYESLGFRHVTPEEIGPMHYERADVFMRLTL